MKRFSLLLILLATLSACQIHDEQYYLLHPKEIKQALSNCSSNNLKHVSCQQLEVLAEKTRRLIYELRLSPQGFGKSILKLQEKIASLKRELHKPPNQPNLKKSLEKNKLDLKQRLAIVRWLESPE